jgi:hypothetical protein
MAGAIVFIGTLLDYLTRRLSRVELLFSAARETV